MGKGRELGNIHVRILGKNGGIVLFCACRTKIAL